MLPKIHDYDKLYRRFRWPKPARYNIGVDVCDRWAARRSRPARDPECPRRRQDRGHHLWLAARDLEPARQHACRARHRARRPGRDAAAADAGSGRRPYRDLQARRRRAAACDPVRRRCAELSAAECRCEGTHHQRAGPREARRDPRRAARSSLVLSIDGAGDGALGFCRDARARDRSTSRRSTRRPTIQL